MLKTQKRQAGQRDTDETATLDETGQGCKAADASGESQVNRSAWKKDITPDTKKKAESFVNWAYKYICDERAWKISRKELDDCPGGPRGAAVPLSAAVRFPDRAPEP